MRYVYLVLTILLLYTLMRVLKGNYIPLILIFMVSLAIGLIIRFSDKSETKKIYDLGWGLLYGTLILATLTVTLIVLFFFHL